MLPTAHPARRLGLLLTLILCLLALLPAGPARAADLTAGTEAELNAAIAAVNAAGAGTHTITLSADIILTDWSTPFDNPAATAIILDGAGHTIDGGGNGNESILSVAAGTTARVRDITLTNAQASAGGGILNEGTLTVEGSHITANEASLAGGGIYSTGQLTIIDTTISDNSARNYGGGIVLEGEATGLTMQNSTLSGNEAGYAGGGLHAINYQAQVIVLTNVTVSGNHSAYGAGGAQFFAGDGELTVTITNSRLVNNTGYHGALWIDSSGVAEVTVSGSTVAGNRSTAADGLTLAASGGIYATAQPGGTTSLTLFNSTVSGNSTGRAGGGLLVAANGGAVGANVVYSTLAENTAAAGGGGIHTTAANGGVASVRLAATIITNGLGAGPDCAAPGVGAAIISTGFNLAGDDTCFPDEDDDSDLIASAAGLLPLALNAPATTPTHALSVTSPARDRIPRGGLGCGTAISADQRGVARPQPAGGRCDIGAFERRPGETPEFRMYLPGVWGSSQ